MLRKMSDTTPCSNSLHIDAKKTDCHRFEDDKAITWPRCPTSIQRDIDDKKYEPCEEWQCQACTFLNRKHAVLCHLCKAKRGTNDSPLPQNFEGRKTISSAQCPSTCLEEQNKEVSVSHDLTWSGNTPVSSMCSDAVHSSTKEPECHRCGEWRCLVCTFVNREHSFVCHMCKAKRGRCESLPPQKLEDSRTVSTTEYTSSSPTDKMANEGACANPPPQHLEDRRCLSCTLVYNKAKTLPCPLCKAKKQKDRSPPSQTYIQWKDGDVPESGCKDKLIISNFAKDFLENETRVVVFGTSRDAKVKVANSLLDRKVFESSTTSNRSEVGCLPHSERSIIVIYAPALFDPNLDEKEISKELWRMVFQTAPGPHVFIYVEDNEDTEVDDRALAAHVGLYGEDVLKATVRICFGGSENAAHLKYSVNFGISLIFPDSSCLRRKTLMAAVETVMEENRNSYFTHDLFFEAERYLQYRRWEVLRKESSMEKLERLEEELVKMRSIDDQNVKKIEKLEKEINRCKSRLKQHEEKLRQKERAGFMNEANLKKIFDGIKIVGGHLLRIALSFFFRF